MRHAPASNQRHVELPNFLKMCPILAERGANDKDANRRRPELVSRRSTMVPLKIAELLVCLFTATSDTVQIVVGPSWLPAPENARLISFLQQVA
jgi:hypothetical protein